MWKSFCAVCNDWGKAAIGAIRTVLHEHLLRKLLFCFAGVDRRFKTKQSWVWTEKFVRLQTIKSNFQLRAENLSRLWMNLWFAPSCWFDFFHSTFSNELPTDLSNNRTSAKVESSMSPFKNSNHEWASTHTSLDAVSHSGMLSATERNRFSEQLFTTYWIMWASGVNFNNKLN